MTLNMCMFATRLEYDAAVRRQFEKNQQRSIPLYKSNRPRHSSDKPATDLTKIKV